MVTLLPTLVTPEWTSAAASHLNNLQGCTCTAQLWQEAALLEQLIYKNISQHRNTRPFQRLLQVRRLLRLLQEVFIDDTVCSLKDAVSLCSRPTLSLHERQVPSAESALHVLQLVLGCCRLTESLADATLIASFQFTTQLAQSFFMPISLTCLAILARVRALGAQLLVDLIRIYNCCIELIDLLPFETSKYTNTSDSDAKIKKINSLPQMLRCSWTDGRPTLIQVGSSSAGGDDSGVKMEGIQRPQAIPSSTAAAEKVRENDAEEGALAENKNKKIPMITAATAELTVIEDRGVAISREQLMTELRHNAAQAQLQVDVQTTARTAAGGITDTITATATNKLNFGAVVAGQSAPEYDRAEVNLANTGAALGVPGSMLLKKRKKGGGPKITIIPNDRDVGGGSGGSGTNINRSGGSLNVRSSKTLKPRLEALPPRSTAFISVESLQKKPKIEATKRVVKDEAAAEGVAVALPPAAATAATADLPSVKSWEDWLAPLGSSDKKQQQQGIGNSKKKARRR